MINKEINKIIFFTENSYKGGLDTFIIALINHWPDKNDEITLICNSNHPGIETYERELKGKIKFKWHRLVFLKDIRKSLFSIFNKQQIVAKLIYHFIKLFKSFFLAYYVVSLKKILLEGQPDRLMVINGGYPAGLSCRAATICWGLFSKKQKAIHNFHNISIPIMKNRIFETFIDKLVEQNSSHLVSVSKMASESIRCRKAFENSKKINFIYNGIGPLETENKYQSDIKQELSLRKDTQVCLMLGTYEPRKGHSFLFKVFSKVVELVPATHLIICGYGSENEVAFVRNQVEQFNIQNNVSLLNFRNDLDNLFKDTDVLLISSQEFESFGLTAVEAMAHKVPVVSTNTGGLKEVIKHGEGGYVFEKDDVENYAAKVIELLQNEDLRLEQGIKGQKRFVNNFKAERMTSAYASLIKANRKT